ncbi:uncharacterized protein LOC126733907 isoform X3 [Anthonomus grandis grandis]|uniref:uncharacterized protein LOC126733907 isoform X3 n=1 Tax=Anthonomus grandis grandis TaxID=2921223 RepID=UPI002164F478|nr:uncharacterized protein LOC126733907 isoform X3 [Anthonomus grandis grandis]
MISAIISRVVILVFGTLYPAYASYKAVKSKHVKEYVKWMMYWIVFALFTCTETFTDIFLSWFPFYYEIKIILVIWLLSPATKGSSILYRKFVHPMLSSREQEIDEYINKAKEQSYRQVLDLGQKGVTVLMQTAIKSGGGIVNQLKKSYSLGDLSDPTNEASDEADDVLVMDPRLVRRRRPGRSPHRSSSASSASVYFSEVDVASSSVAERVTEVRSVEDISSGYSSGEQLYIANQPLKLQARESIANQRTSSLTRSRSTRVTRSTLPKKASITSDDSDENEVFDTNIIFLNDQAKKIDKLQESSSSESEFYDIPENNHDFQLHGKVRPICSNNPDSESQMVHNNVGCDDAINVTACHSDNDTSSTFPLSLSLNLSKLSSALSSLHSSVSNILPSMDNESRICLEAEEPKPLEIVESAKDSLKSSSTDDFKLIETDLSQKISNLKAEFLANSLSSVSNAPLPPKPPPRDQRGGKYNKKHAPLPPLSTNIFVNPIKATLVLQPGVLRSLSSSAESLSKEVFVNYSPKVKRRSRNQSPVSRSSSDSSSSSKTEKVFSKMLRLPKKMAHLSLPGSKKDKRHSWSEFFHGSSLDNVKKSKSRSASTLDTISETTNKEEDVSQPIIKRSDSQISMRSLSNSPTAHRRIKDQSSATLPRAKKTIKKKTL